MSHAGVEKSATADDHFFLLGVMQRNLALERLSHRVAPWDMVVIGGGATGLGVAVEAAARGLETLLVEQDDFCKGTSSRSTKLIHGGVRYLRQGNFLMVRDALHERERLLQNASHIVHPLPLVVPIYSWLDFPVYGTGLKLYDWLAGRRNVGRSLLLSASRTIERLPTLRTAKLKGGVLYFDAQFDDARLGIALAKTCSFLGGTVVNYMRAVELLKEQGKVRGVTLKDALTGAEYEVRARSVVNAAGAYVDTVRMLDDSEAKPLISASQGAHIVLASDFLPGETAMLVPRTADGRVLFAIPWQGRTLVGTTDVPIRELSLEPVPLREEIAFLLDHTAKYLARVPSHSDILSAFAGIRPLVAGGGGGSTSALSRDHQVVVSDSGLVSIVGGKWTTYRKMAEDVVNQAVRVSGLRSGPSITATLRLGVETTGSASEWGAISFAEYGDGRQGLAELMRNLPDLAVPIHPRLPYLKGQIVWAVREEMAVRLEDVLARRTRALLLDCRATVEAAESAAGLMAAELGWSEGERKTEVERFVATARGYLPSSG